MNSLDTAMTNSLSNAASMAKSNAAMNKIMAIKSSTLSDEELGKIDQAAKDFEAVFISEMMKPIFETVEIDSNFGGGKGEEIFKGMMVQEYGKIMAEKGGLGIAEHVKAELIRIQESAK